jgi:hypothetical protein
LLVDRPGTRVLDVGAAVGKFCIVGGVSMPEATFVGVERRPHLFQIASDLVRQLALRNVMFAQGDATEIDWSLFDAFYLFNPFAEHLRDGVPVLDETIELAPACFQFYVQFVRARLAAARIGTRVVVYHGFGAPPPDGYVLAVNEPAGSDRLELWIKTGTTGRRTARDEPVVDYGYS